MSAVRDFRDLDGADPWKLLGVRRDADADEIRRSYRRLSRSHHTDVGGDATQQAKLNRAYEVLSDPVRRADYLKLLNGPPAQPEPEPEEPAGDPFEWSSGPYTQRAHTPPRRPGPHTAPQYQDRADPHTVPPFQADPRTAPPYQGDPHTAPPFRNPYSAAPHRDPYAAPVHRPGGVNSDALIALFTSIVCPPASLILAIRGLRKIRRTGQRGRTIAWLAIVITIAFPTWAVVNNLLKK
ncbi:hypothetical protein JOF29_001248 [Kribbella aluminosa]|uniref:J domain-containing protein n=1 Tax=Kribbella aluminosa TaxID=416017 RepID=A0ABS4UEV9_9ACTN|nr:DUF4190 domain-containing protein [Kribbella aluminosa]MBP2350165.1 hypothetical protein [Kribbella aluminosa]